MIKLVFIPADSDDQFVIEGEATEVAEAVAAVRSVYAPRAKAGFLTPTAAKTDEVVVINSPEDRARKIESFLGSLYVYASNRENDSGRGRWIAEQLMTFNTFNIDLLAKSAHATVPTVHNNIKRLRDGGAVVDVDTTNNTVRVVSFPENKRFIKKRRSPAKNPQPSNPSKKSSGTLDTTALKGLKLGN